MNTSAHIGKWLYATAFAVFGVQHFIYAKYAATLVPNWLPWHMLFNYLVAIGFLAAAFSILINKHMRLSCMLLGATLAIFILVIHLPNLYRNPQNAQGYTRALQDVVIMGTALMITGDVKWMRAGKYFFALPMIILGLQHFTHTDFATAKVPLYFAAISLWDYMIGAIMVISSAAIISNRYLTAPAWGLAVALLLLALLYHVPLLVSNIQDGRYWTGLMIDIAVAAGAFVVAGLPVHKPVALRWQHDKAETFL